MYSDYVWTDKCTYCQAWLPFHQSHTALYKSLQLWGHSQLQSMTEEEKEDKRKRKNCESIWDTYIWSGCKLTVDSIHYIMIFAVIIQKNNIL